MIDGEQGGDPTMWPLFIILSVGLLLVLLLAVGPRFTRGTRAVPHEFYCALRRQPVRVEYRVAAWDGKLVDVDRCSAFTPPTAIGCDKLCLRPEEFALRAGPAGA